MKSLNIKHPIILLTVFFLIFTFNPKRIAAQSLSLSISPPILELIIKPGKSITQVYKLANNGDSVIITPKLMKLDENGILEDSEYIGENWISLINTDVSFNSPFMLQSNTEKQIILKISPPQKSAEENYYRALVFSTSPNPIANTSLTSVSQNIGSVLLINVTTSGLLNKSAKISRFELPTLLDSFGPLTVKANILNTGKTYFRPNGQLTIIGPLGKAVTNLNPAVIFEGQTKTATKENSVFSRNQDDSIIIDGFFLGKYEVEMKFVIDEGSTEISAKKTVYALPWKLILVILILILGFQNVFRRNKKKHDKK